MFDHISNKYLLPRLSWTGNRRWSRSSLEIFITRVRSHSFRKFAMILLIIARKTGGNHRIFLANISIYVDDAVMAHREKASITKMLRIDE